MKKWLKKFWVFFYRTVEVLLAFAFVAVLMLFWRLAQGPIEIKGFTPLLAKALLSEDAPPMKVVMDTAFLELGFDRNHLLDITATNIAFIRADGQVELEAPKIYVSFDFFELLRKQFIPQSIVFEQPYFHFEINDEKKAEKQVKSSGSEFLKKTQKILSDINHLDSFTIIDGTMAIDLKKNEKQISLTELNVDLFHDTDETLTIKSDFKVYSDEKFTPFWLSGSFTAESSKLMLETTFKDIDLNDISFFTKDAFVADMVIDGQVRFFLSLDKISQDWRYMVDSILFDVHTQKEGNLFLAGELNTSYPIKTGRFVGNIDKDVSAVHLTTGTINLYGPMIRATADVEELGDFLDSDDLSVLKTNLSATVLNMPMKRVPEVWPSSLGGDAHSWVKENIPTGIVDKAYFVLKFDGSNLSTVKGLCEVSDADVNYLDGQPTVSDVKANVVLQLGQVDIEILSGHVDDLNLTGGMLNLTELYSDKPMAKMALNIDGQLKTALDILDRKPLNFLSDFGIDATVVSGQATGKVLLDFPLTDDTTPSDVMVDVEAKAMDVQMPVPNLPLSLKDGQFNLSVQNDGLDLTGSALVDDMPTTLIWKNHFKPDSNLINEYDVSFDLSPSYLEKYVPNVQKYIKGNAVVKLDAKQDRTTNISLDLFADLKDMEVKFPISYTKEIGTEATFAMLMTVFPDKTEIKSVVFEAPEDKALIEGDALFNGKTILNLTKIQTEQNDASLTFEKDDNQKIFITLTGEKLNLYDILHPDSQERQKISETNEVVLKIPDFSFKTNIDYVMTGKDAPPLSNVKINLDKHQGKWEDVSIDMMTTVPFVVRMTEDKQHISVGTQNMGELLWYLGFTDRLRGGVLNGQIEQTQDGTLSGVLTVNDYQLTKASVLMQLATVLGVIDAFSDTIDFKRARIPFDLSPDFNLTLKDVVASGTNLGITLQGVISPDNIALDGTFVPAYAINSLLGKIPLIGGVFSAEKGGGLIGLAFSIKGKPSDIKTETYPSSMLTPGFIRKIFQD